IRQPSSGPAHRDFRGGNRSPCRADDCRARPRSSRPCRPPRRLQPARARARPGRLARGQASIQRPSAYPQARAAAALSAASLRRLVSAGFPSSWLPSWRHECSTIEQVSTSGVVWACCTRNRAALISNVRLMANPYETLGVAPNASQDDIRRAYRKAAKETHPDLNPGKPEAENRFNEINAAYDIIGDADKRKRYDAGEIDETGAERQPERHFYREYAEADPNTRYSRRGASAQGRGDRGADFDYDIFADLFG